MTLGDRVAVLRKGVLQQTAHPRELYDHPTNLFVAGFIGSPPMNFLPARIEGGRAVLPIADIVLSEQAAKQVAGRDLLVAGIRPEHFEDVELVPPDKRACGVEFTADIELTEWLGSEHLAYVPFAAPSTIMDDLRALARELDGEVLRTQLVVSIDPASRI